MCHERRLHPLFKQAAALAGAHVLALRVSPPRGQNGRFLHLVRSETSGISGDDRIAKALCSERKILGVAGNPRQFGVFRRTGDV
jgi:hypothetical protein